MTKEKIPLINRYDQLKRKTPLLLLATFQIFLGILLFALPPIVYANDFFKDLITKFDGPWPYLCATFLLTNAFSTLLIYVLKLDVLYFDIILSRVLGVIGYVTLFYLKQIKQEIASFFITFDILFIVMIYFSVKNDQIPSIYLTNIEMPSSLFSFTLLLIMLTKAVGLYLFTSWVSLNVLVWVPPPSFWSKILVIILLNNSFLWFRAMRKLCSVYLLGYAIGGRMVEILSLCGVVILYGINPTNYVLGYLIFDCILMIWTLFYLKEKEIPVSVNKK